MKNRSKINKGLRFENYLLEILREQVDKDTHRIPGSGSGLDKNDLRIASLNIEIEAKNADEFKIPGDWAQVERQLTTGNVGVLAIRHPQRPEFEKTLIVMDLGDWIDLLQGAAGKVDIVSNKDPELKYLLRRLKDTIRQVDKKLEYE